MALSRILYLIIQKKKKKKALARGPVKTRGKLSSHSNSYLYTATMLKLQWTTIHVIIITKASFRCTKKKKLRLFLAKVAKLQLFLAKVAKLQLFLTNVVTLHERIER